MNGGWIKTDLTLNDREWVCVNHGCEHDRDVNAVKKHINRRHKPLSRQELASTLMETMLAVAIRCCL